MKNRHFKYMRSAASLIHDPTTLTIVDYSYLQKIYRYSQTPLLPYYKWFNIEKTLWDTILKLTKESERQNFIFIELPKVIPSVSSLRTYTEKTNNTILRIFDQPSKNFILEMWRWISEEAREQSILGNFKQENLDKVNIVFTHANKWCVMNLGQFNKWRKTPKSELTEETEVEDSVSITYTPLQLQKLLLKFFISIESQTTIPDEDLTVIQHSETPPDHQPGVDDEHSDVEVNDTEKA